VLTIRKILLPLDLLESALPSAAIHQATALARHFGSEILLLHVVRPLTYVGNEKDVHELLEQSLKNEQEKLEQCLGSDREGITILRTVVRGDPAREIVRTAQDQTCDLIVLPTHGYGALGRFLLGSVTAKVLHSSECPVWTGAHVSDVPVGQFAIRNILVAVDFSSHAPKTIQWAQGLATEFHAEVTLAHATPGVEIYGPGGYHSLPDMKQELVGSATRRMSRVQQDLGTNAKVFIGSGDVPKVIHQAAKETSADLVVVGRRASLGGRLGTIAYGIIRESQVPVVSV
jgi:nucleotide-binding universal stress UspA family protein